ncbi:hypothetical protein G6514_008274 [Epicoccum nigrum]|nr:hypothetical protein G6514_008274 [Epicoccum nigrum]
MHLLPAPLLTLLYLTLTSAASPSPPFLSASDDYSISLVPRHTLFYRQLKDLQSFSGSLGGVRASSIMNSGIPDRPFQVEGANFPDFESAAMRSCDEQFDGCQRMANAKGGGGGGGGGGSADADKAKKGKARDEAGKLTVNMCDEQKNSCKQTQQTAEVKDFSPRASENIGPDPLFPDFDLICEG